MDSYLVPKLKWTERLKQFKSIQACKSERTWAIHVLIKMESPVELIIVPMHKMNCTHVDI